MIGPAAPLLPDIVVIARISKLLGGLAPLPSTASAKAIAAGSSPLVSAGPLGAIKDPTAASAMSIVQLGQGESKAEQVVPILLGEASAELPGAYVQTVEQKYAANSAVSAAAMEGGNSSPGLVSHLERPVPQISALGEPLLFIPSAPYMQSKPRKSRARSSRLRASWQFIFGNSADPEP